MCQSAVSYDGPRMSLVGYKRTLWGRALNFRFTPESRHSNRHFRFRIVFVCVAPSSGPTGSTPGESEVDPERTSCSVRESGGGGSKPSGYVPGEPGERRHARA